MRETDGCPRGERRRLTAAWLNIMAAGLVSAGALPLVTAVALEGLGSRAEAMGSLAALALFLGTFVHLIGRSFLRAPARSRLDSCTRKLLVCSGSREAPVDENSPSDNQPFPTERDIEALLEEFGGDPRAAIRALLHDLDALASDYEAAVSKGYIRSRPTRRSAGSRHGGAQG